MAHYFCPIAWASKFLLTRRVYFKPITCSVTPLINYENLSCNFSNLAFANFIAGGSLFNRFLIGNSIGNTLPPIGNRPIFDGLFFGGSSIFARKPRQIIRRPR